MARPKGAKDIFPRVTRKQLEMWPDASQFVFEDWVLELLTRKLVKPRHQPKFQWQSPDGEIKIMCKANAHRHHPDWILIGPVES